MIGKQKDTARRTRRVSIARTSVATVLGVVGATVFFTLANCENRSCIP